MNQEAKEKAIEIFNIYKKYYDDEKAKQKTHAMIDRIIKSFRDHSVTFGLDMGDDIMFYKQVKQELDKL